MAIIFKDIKDQVTEMGDGRTFSASKHAKWANNFRRTIAMSFQIAGFNGLYFLYKEASVKDGSVANQANYAIPDDFIDDLNVFYDGTLLGKAPPGLLDISQGREAAGTIASGTPKWVQLAGVEFLIIPAPEDAEKTIFLLYNGLPSDISTTSNDNFTDYFLNHFADLHVFGIGEKMARSIGLTDVAQDCSNQKATQARELQLHNRRHYYKNSHLRFQNWSEYESIKRIVFPQFVIE